MGGRVIKIPFRRPSELNKYLPPWLYGAAYEDYNKRMQIFYPIPFNYLVRYVKTVKFLWDRWRSNYSWLDEQVFKEASKDYKEWRELNEAIRQDCARCKERFEVARK